MSFVLLKSKADWEKHCEEIVVQLAVCGDTIDWGQGPKQYPCLITQYRVNALKVLSAYVYPDDAVRLLKAVPEKLVAASKSTARKTKAKTVVSDVTPDIETNSREQSAHLLTCVEFLIRTGICTEAQYEERYRRMLAHVDQIVSEKRYGLPDITDNLRRSEKLDE